MLLKKSGVVQTKCNQNSKSKKGHHSYKNMDRCEERYKM